MGQNQLCWLAVGIAVGFFAGREAYYQEQSYGALAYTIIFCCLTNLILLYRSFRREHVDGNRLYVCADANDPAMIQMFYPDSKQTLTPGAETTLVHIEKFFLNEERVFSRPGMDLDDPIAILSSKKFRIIDGTYDIVFDMTTLHDEDQYMATYGTWKQQDIQEEVLLKVWDDGKWEVLSCEQRVAMGPIYSGTGM
jgi:hypothetical protein